MRFPILNRLAPTGLLGRFLLILAPIFLILISPGIAYLVTSEFRADNEILAARIGNLAARNAASLSRHNQTADLMLINDLMAPLAADRSFVCAEYFSINPRQVIAALPSNLGCRNAHHGKNIVLPVGQDGVQKLLVRFSDAELVSAKKLRWTLIISVITLAFCAALVASSLGFRLIVGRPLRLLREGIDRSTLTGEKVQIRSSNPDELGIVISAFNRMQARATARDQELIVANTRLLDSELNLRTLNQKLEQRVSERTRDLEAAKLRAEDDSNAKTQFIQSVSHELRTPLNAILGFSDLLKQQHHGALGDTKYVEFAHEISEGGNALLEIINNMLDIAEISSGSECLNEDKVQCKSLFESCLRNIVPICETAGVKIVHAAPDETLVLWVDRSRIKQVLHNILTNAVKFTPKEGLVDFSVNHIPGQGVDFVIRDTGIGMKKEDIAMATSPFGRLDNALARKKGGIGLGLPLASMLTAIHGGSLSIKSKPATGTTITVHLPETRVVNHDRAISSAT